MILSSITGGTADINVNGHTDITGALIAAIDDEGNDTGNLDLHTGTISFSDLSNRHYNSNQSASIGANVGLGDTANPADPNQSNTDLALNSSTYTYQNESSQSLDKTLVTIGNGNITVDDESADLTALNRDTSNTTNEIYDVDRQQGNIDLAVDHRLLSEEGREEIAEEAKQVADKVVAVKRQIQTWGNQAPPKVQLVMPQIENFIESSILKGRDVDKFVDVVQTPEFIKAAQGLAPLIELAETNPEVLEQAMELAKVIKPGEPLDDSIDTITINGSYKTKTEIVHALGVMNKAVEAVTTSDSAEVVQLLAVALGGVPALVTSTAISAVVGDAIEEIHHEATTHVAAWATDSNADDFNDDVAHEQIYQDDGFYQTVEGGASLAVTLSTIAVTGKAASKKGKADGVSKDGSARSTLLGANGTKTFSTTLWKGEGKERIDVENPNPGQRAGQVHYQDNKNNKYLYDPISQTFPNAPKSVNKKLKDKEFKAAIDKAMKKYLGE